MDGTLTMSRTGDVVTINGEDFDFSVLPDGALLPRDAIDSPWISGAVTRDGGVLNIPMILPHGPDASETVRNPDPVEVTEDGPISLPE
jgi:hypothetical protein